MKYDERVCKFKMDTGCGELPHLGWENDLH